MTDREIIITRTLNAPRDLVFRMWLDPRHVAQWWGPNGFTITTEKMDVRPGGAWRFIMHGPDGVDYPNEIVYTEITPPERLVFTHGTGQGDADQDFHVTVTFDSQGTKTQLTMRSLFQTAAQRDMVVEKYGAIEGGNQTLARLDAYLAQQNSSTASDVTPLIIVREFNAPRALVFKAWTEEKHLRNWWGPKGYTWLGATLDARPNGVFHYHMRSPQGEEQWGKFVFREITPPERLVFVTSFSDPQGNIVRAPFSADWPLEVQNVLIFTEKDGKTTLTMQGIPINAAPNELQMFENMKRSLQGGFKGTLDQLEAYLQVESKK